MSSPSDNSTSPISGGQYIRYGPPPVVPGHTLLRTIGRGSYGEVWLARDVIEMYRAVKVVYRSTFPEDGPYEREFEGIRKFAPVSLSHGSQVHILLINRNDQEGYFYYVMELADDASRARSAECGARSGESQSLKSPTAISDEATAMRPETYVPWTLQHELETRGRLPFAECLKISHALADAVKHLHDNGLVHRDIKPANIIFVNGIPKLADIGLVTGLDASLTYGSTQGFIAPEGAGRPQGDIYSLGKVIYEMWSGQDRLKSPELPPGWAEWPDREQVSELRAVSNRACEPETAKRYATADDLIKDLDLLKAGKSVRLLRMLQRGRRRALAAAVAVAVVGLVAATGVWFFGRVREQAQEREVLVRYAQMLRIGDRQQGWSSKALQRLARAGRGQPDDLLREQAAASLEGLDAQVVRQCTNNPVRCVAFDPQGRRLLMDAGGSGRVQLWDLQSDQPKSLSTTDTGPVWFASGGSCRQFCVEGGGGLWLLNPETGDRLREFRWPEGTVHKEWVLNAGPDSQDWSFCAAASADGLICAAALTCPTNAKLSLIAVWESETGKLVAQSAEGCSALAFSPDNALLATGDGEGRVRVRALSDLTDVAVLPNQGRSPIHCLAFARDPSQLADGSAKCPWLVAVGDAGGTISIYQVALGRVKAICRGSAYDVYTVAFSPDGMTLASGGRGATRFWDVATGRILLTSRPLDYQYALGFSPDGGKLAFGTLDVFGPASSGIIELEPSRGVMALRGLSSQCAKVEFSHDSQRLAALSHNWELGIWNLGYNRLERLLEAPKGLYADNAALTFNRDDSQFAFATLSEARLWDLKSGRLLRKWPLPKGLVEYLCFDPTGRLLLFQWDRPWEPAARMCRVRDLFKPDYETPIAEFPEFKGRVFDAVLSQKGDSLAVVGEQARGTNIVRVFDPLNGRQIYALTGTGIQGNDSLARDPEGSRVGCWFASSNQTVFLNMPNVKLWRAFPGQANALSPNGRWLSKSAGGGQGVTVFSADHPAKHFTIGLDHTVGFWPRFSPNGRLLAFGTPEGTVLVCDLEATTARLEQLGLGWR